MLGDHLAVGDTGEFDGAQFIVLVVVVAHHAADFNVMKLHMLPSPITFCFKRNMNSNRGDDCHEMQSARISKE